MGERLWLRLRSNRRSQTPFHYISPVPHRGLWLRLRRLIDILSSSFTISTRPFLSVVLLTISIKSEKIRLKYESLQSFACPFRLKVSRMDEAAFWPFERLDHVTDGVTM